MLSTVFPCPRRMSRGFPVAVSQSRTEGSEPSEANVAPSGKDDLRDAIAARVDHPTLAGRDVPEADGMVGAAQASVFSSGENTTARTVRS